MALLFPTLKLAKDKAKKIKAKTEVNQLEMAWKSYFSDYRGWPGSYGNSENDRSMDNAAVRLLMGQPIVPADNVRNIPYMEFKAGSTNNAGEMIDPWRRPYLMRLDLNNDGTVNPLNMGSIPRQAAVWSTGIRNGYADDGVTTDPSNPSDPADDVRSWE
jgi:hypothetical protein